MSKTSKLFRAAACGVFILGILAGVPALAADDSHGTNAEAAIDETSAVPKGLIAIGAALAIGLPAIGTGLAQSKIGAAGIGAIAENPKRLGTVIMLIAIPETVAILGFVIAYLILSQ